MKLLKNNLFKLILFGLEITLLGNQGVSQVTDPVNMTISNYISSKKIYYDNLSNQGIDINTLSDYKNYKRSLDYLYTFDYENLTLNDIATSFKAWQPSGGWGCVINTYPELAFNEVGPSLHTERIISDTIIASITNSSITEHFQRISGTGQIHFLEFDYSLAYPNQERMFACSGYGGLFTTGNNGQNWSNAGTDFGLPSSGVSSIALSISSPENTWYITTGNAEFIGAPEKHAVGIWRTTNGGASYQHISNANFGGDNSELDNASKIRKVIALNGNNGHTRLVVTSEAGLFSCENGNATNPIWTKIASGKFYDVEVRPNNQSKIYASGDEDLNLYEYDFSTSTLNSLSTLNMNSSFIADTTVRRTTIEFCHALEDELYIVVFEDGISRLYRYNILSQNMTLKSTLQSDGGAGVGEERAMAWDVSPVLVNNEVLIAHGNVKKVRLGRDLLDFNPINWIEIHSEAIGIIHDDAHFMKFNPSANQLYVGNDGGMYKTNILDPNLDYSAYIDLWQELNTGLGVGTVHNISTSQNGSRRITSSYQDMGCIRLEKDNNNKWIPNGISKFGDGSRTLINAIDSDNMITNTQYTTGGLQTFNNWDVYSSYKTPNSAFLKSIKNNAKDRGIVYSASKSGLQRSVNSSVAASYSILPNTQGPGLTRFVYHVNPSENPKYSDYIYVTWLGGHNEDTLINIPTRIYKSTVGGGLNPANWEMVYQSEKKSFPVIAQNFNNPDIIFFAESGKVWELNTTNNTNPVNVSTGLPSNIGIKDICYVNGSNDALYVATNYGVYYRDENTNFEFQKICGIPNARATDIEIDYCRKKIIVSTYGRGIWESNIELPQDKPYTVKTGETITITGDYYAGTNIIIEPNGTLIVEGTLYMPKDSKIDVMPAGNLRVVNGKITNGCDGLWDGISVWGNHSDHTQSYSIQGHAFFDNAIVENANIAVRNYGKNADGRVNWDSRGGIIQATETEFLNNRRDAAFQSYQRTWGGSSNNLANDQSYFRDVKFKTTDEFRHANTMNHVTMYKTYGIRFTGCNFIDDRVDDFSSTWLDDRKAANCGIRSVDAKYTVSGKCLGSSWLNCTGDLSTNPSGWKPTTFTNLDFGIYASNASTENNITVDRCEFTNNRYGVVLVKSNSPTVTRSHFISKDTDNRYNGHAHLGIHAIALSELRIEENLFVNDASDLTANPTYGIVCSNLGESGEQTYLNRFENLTVASLTQGKNRSVSNNGLDGLQFLCNKNENNIQDHKVLGTLWSDPDAPNYTSNTYGVRNNNGGDNFKSGVEFTQNQASVEDYENFSTNSIKFWYDPSNPDEIPVEKTSNVNLGIYLDNDPDACSSNLTSKPIKLLPVLVKSQLITDFNTNSADLVIAKQDYRALLDCGDTDGLMLLIDNLNPSTKSVLRQELLNCSPYVTTDIIKATLDKKEIEYPNAWCLELILANIDVVRERNFIQFLTDKTNPMPAWMIQTLNWYVVNGYSLTPKAIKELEIADLSYQRNYASDMMIRDFKNDTTGTNLDSVKFWIEQKADIDAQVRLIDIALQKNDLTTAQAKLNVLNADILNYPTHLQSELQDVVTFKTEVISIVGNLGGLANMTEANHTFMTNIATNSEGIAKVQAQELLCFFFDECVEYSFDIPMNSRAMMVDKPTVTKPELNFKLFPNPASDWVTIELPLDVAPVIVTITDLQGKLILNTTVNRPIYIWETDQLPNGVYLINIKTEVGVYDLGTEKVTIQH